MPQNNNEQQSGQQDAFQKSGENFVKGQHKNAEDWARQSRKGAAAMTGQKTDANGYQKSDSQSGGK